MVDNINYNVNESIYNYQSFMALSKKFRLIIFLWLLLAISSFLVRTPMRAIENSLDFQKIYVASTKWVKGENPYKINSIYDLDDACFYPIFTPALVSPLTFLTYEQAKFVWLGFNLMSLLGIFIILLNMMNIYLSDWRAILLISGLFALSPIQNCIFQGQPTLIVLFILLYSYYLSTINKNILAGILLGIGFCLKFHLTIFFFIYYLIMRRRLLIIASIATIIIVGSIAIVRLGLHDFSWVKSWLDNLQLIRRPGGTIDPSPANPIKRQHLLNLQYPLYTIINSKFIVNLIVYIIVAIEMFLFIRYYNGYVFNDLLNISFLAIITLLPVYHWNYDAAFIIVPLALAINYLRTMNNNYAIKILIIVSLFIIPGPSILIYLKDNDIISLYITNSKFWNIIVMPHQAWALLILSILLLYIIVKNNYYYKVSV